ncbi:MAG: HAD family hydrolase [Leucobacter sp.]
MAELKAVLWDLDGTLIDSEPRWFRIQQDLMKEAGLTWTQEDATAQTGNTLHVVSSVMQDRGYNLPVEEIGELMMEGVVALFGESVPWQPGSEELLRTAAGSGLKSALVTMSYRRIADPFLKAVPDVFDAVVTGDTVDHGKPHPDPYLKAMEALGVRPEECIAFEDSVPGVASAVAAGVVTVGIERIIPLADTPAAHVIKDFDGFTAATLHELHAAGLKQ